MSVQKINNIYNDQYGSISMDIREAQILIILFAL